MEDTTRVWFNLVTASLVLVLMISSIVWSVQNHETEAREWEQFSEQHHCTLVGHRNAQVAFRGVERYTIPAQSG